MTSTSSQKRKKERFPADKMSNASAEPFKNFTRRAPKLLKG